MTFCPICKHGSLAQSTVSVTLERGSLTLVVKGVPARVCDNCGEQFVDEETSTRLLQEAEAAAAAGTQVEVRRYEAA